VSCLADTISKNLLVQVFENVLSPNAYDDFANVVNKEYIPWYFYEMVHNTSSACDSNDISTHGFVHKFFDNNKVNSMYIFLLNPILEKLSCHFDCSIIPVRMKMNMNLNIGRQVAPYPHIDKIEAIDNKYYKTAIYYINDSDGDTLFFDDAKNIVCRQTPKKNTLVLFSGDLLHSAQLPIVSPKRLVVNINFILDKSTKGESSAKS